ncbi:MAG: hypothetical protein COU69_00790 [Candidatus Pacebacteria bacterium CG10_big_fil_rev_8_21_14_0_10_56_10]|nr:MAG: hypothetical protein COU69_00790 [Candidatus Pacebacteria bacterium CG10_big_fil_rev_8_21_14_0_10_56_10]
MFRSRPRRTRRATGQLPRLPSTLIFDRSQLERLGWKFVHSGAYDIEGRVDTFAKDNLELVIAATVSNDVNPADRVAQVRVTVRSASSSLPTTLPVTLGIVN